MLTAMWVPLRNTFAIILVVTSPVVSLAQAAKGPWPDRDKFHNETAANGMTFHIRIPKAYDPKKPSPALVILHGSNMNANAYAQTIVHAWPALARDFVIIGINGENRVQGSPDDNPAYNYTYLNFVGKGSTFKGFAGSEKESPALVVQVVQEIKQKLPLSKIFIGGHSQGGWLTMSAYMYFPELFAGAFPVSGGLLVQCEPSAFNDPDVRAAQRRGAIAIVYGERDVEWAPSGKATFESFDDDGFPRLHLFALPQGDHRFALLPVQDAIRWLQESTSDDPAALLTFAERRLKQREYRDALAAADRAAELDTAKAQAKRIEAVRKAIEEPAAKAAATLQPLIEKAKDDSWVAQFVKFRRDFEFTQAAKPVMQSYADLRKEHEKPARDLFNAARKDFNEKKPNDAYAKYTQIVREYYASSWYRYAKSALASRQKSR
jgi:pimeloyl-ACP methyl ester carboxylesterase